LEAGKNLNQVETRFDWEGGPDELEAAVGIVKRAGGDVVFASDSTWMAYWEPELASNGHLGVGVVLKDAGRKMDTPEQAFLVVKVKRGGTLHYQTGAGWSKSGDFPDKEAWITHVSAAK
jgi:hypothetical protein